MDESKPASDSTTFKIDWDALRSGWGDGLKISDSESAASTPPKPFTSSSEQSMIRSSKPTPKKHAHRRANHIQNGVPLTQTSTINSIPTIQFFSQPLGIPQPPPVGIQLPLDLFPYIVTQLTAMGAQLTASFVTLLSKEIYSVTRKILYLAPYLFSPQRILFLRSTLTGHPLIPTWIHRLAFYVPCGPWKFGLPYSWEWALDVLSACKSVDTVSFNIAPVSHFWEIMEKVQSRRPNIKALQTNIWYNERDSFQTRDKFRRVFPHLKELSIPDGHCFWERGKDGFRSLRGIREFEVDGRYRSGTKDSGWIYKLSLSAPFLNAIDLQFNYFEDLQRDEQSLIDLFVRLKHLKFICLEVKECTCDVMVKRKEFPTDLASLLISEIPGLQFLHLSGEIIDPRIFTLSSASSKLQGVALTCCPEFSLEVLINSLLEGASRQLKEIRVSPGCEIVRNKKNDHEKNQQVQVWGKETLERFLKSCSERGVRGKVFEGEGLKKWRMEEISLGMVDRFENWPYNFSFGRMMPEGDPPRRKAVETYWRKDFLGDDNVSFV